MIGKTIGKYKVEETIGGSATSQVYRAKDISTDQDVAIKVLNPHVKTPENVERFRREAKLLLPLKHKNIVTVLDYLVDEDDPMLVLEYIGGKNLRAIIDLQKRILPDIALMIVREVVLGLRQAHFNKIVHRDLKPENILITQEGNLKISDFGLAKFFEAEGITKPGTVIGTPAFMSPEQMKGIPADGRSDIFSLGVIFYLMVSNKYPFDGESKKEVFESIQKKYPIPLNELVPNIPIEIMKIIDRCLEKEVETRYRSVDQLLFDIDSYLSYYGMQEYEGYLREYLRDPEKGEEEITRFVIDETIRSGYKYYYIRDKDSVIRFFKKLTDIRGLTEDAIDTLIKKKKPGESKRNAMIVGGLVLMIVLSFLIGRWTTVPLKNEGAKGGPDKIAESKPDKLEKKAALKKTPKKKRTPKPKVVAKKKPVKRKQPKRKRREPIVSTPAPKPSKPAPQAGMGELKIIAEPWAYVFIDDKYYGKTPIYDNIRLASGVHKMVLKNPECEKFSDDFSIAKNEIVTKEITLAYLPSRIKINLPEGANLYVDDQLVDLGNTADPFEFTHGKHEVRVEKPGYQIYRNEIEVLGGRDLKLNVKLKRLK